MKRHRPSSRHAAASSASAFTLIEILAVLAVVTVLAVITIPSITTSLRSMHLTQATQQTLDQLHLAGQSARSVNRTMETRFYRYTGEKGWRHMQNFMLKEDGTSEPYSRMVDLPFGVVISPDSGLSPMLGSTRTKTWSATDPQTPLPGGIGLGYETRRILFHPDGTTDLPVGSQLWFLTLHTSEKGENLSALPANFSVIQVDPWTGRSQLYRP